MSDQLTEEDRKVSIDRLVSALKGHGDSNMSEKDVVELAAKTEEVAYTKHPTNKKEYFSIIASKLMRITQRTTQKQPASAVPMPMSSNIGVSTQPMMGMNMNMPPGGMFTAGPAMGMPIQRTNISVSGTASNPIAISTNAISNNPNPMNMGGYTTAVAPKPVTVPQPAVGAEDADWDKYTEKHNQLATRYVTILEQMMKQFEKASDLNPSFETFKNRIQNFYRILKEPNFRPAKTPEESIKALEVMEKNIESWVHSITQRKGTNPATHLGAHPAQPPVHPQPHTQPLSSHPQPPTAHLQPHTQPPTSHPQPPIAHPQAHAQPLHSQPPHIQQPHVQPQPPHPPASIVSPPAAAVPMPLPTQPAIISPQPTPQPPIQPEKSPLPPQASPPIASPSFVPMQPIVTQAPPTVIRTSEESHESSVEEFFTPGIITGFLDKLSKTSQDLKEMKTVLERITKIPTTDDASNAIQSDDSGLPGKSLKPPTSAHHKRFWWSRDSNSDWNKVKEEKLKSSDGFSTFGLKRAKKNDEALSGVDADFSGMHPIFPAVAKAVRGLMKNPEARSLKRVFKSVDENKLFIELVMEEHKPEAATSAYLMQLELFPDQKINNQVSVGVTVKRTVMDKAHDSVTSVFMPALIELQALSHSSDTDADKWIGFLSCYKRYLEQYNALFSQIEELQSCGYDITSSINHDATALLSCRLDSQVLVPALQVIVYLDGKTCKGPEIQYSEEHDLFLQDVKANLESKIRSLSRVVQQPTLPLILSAWKSIVELQYL